MTSRLAKDAALGFVEFLFLLMLWTIFVGNPTWHEISIGLIAALFGATADDIVKAEDFAPFRPHLRWIVLIFWEAWYALKGAVAAFSELARSLTGHKPDAQFLAIPYCYGGDNATAAAKRALFTAYMTISPDTIVVGVDRDKHIALVHQLGSSEIPEIARRLGAEA